MMFKGIAKILFGIFLVLSTVVFTKCGSGEYSNAKAENMLKAPMLKTAFFGEGIDWNRMVNSLIEHTSIQRGGYVLIIPTAGLESEKMAKALRKQFYVKQVVAVHIFDTKELPLVKRSDVLAIENAKIICFVGAANPEFVKLFSTTGLTDALITANNNGGTIASIGSANLLMGKKYLSEEEVLGVNSMNPIWTAGLGLVPSFYIGNINIGNKYGSFVQGGVDSDQVVFMGFDSKSTCWLRNWEVLLEGTGQVKVVEPKSEERFLKSGEIIVLPH